MAGEKLIGITGFLFVVAFLIWFMSAVAEPSGDKVAEGVNLIAQETVQEAIPWWLEPLDKIVAVSGPLAVVFLFGLTIFPIRPK